MAIDMTVRESISVAGKNFPASFTVSSEAVEVREVTLAGANAGTLSTRTDADTGILTLGDGHNITTAAEVDIYWATGSRRGVTVGTVSVNSVPVDGGSGDDFPDADTAITVMIVDVEDLVLTGDNVVAFTAYAPVQATFVLLDGMDAELYAIVLPVGRTAAIWDGTSTNPLATFSVATLKLSHASTASQTIRIAVLFN
ncbi:MAG: hypothetical protein KGZ39_05695 [Simkania sp.]|nr:hypothetical protein [Simkania sp.]